MAVFADDHLGQQSRCGNTTLLQTVGQGRNDWRKFRLLFTHEFAPYDLAAEELPRPVVQHFGDFFSNTAERFRIVSDFLRFDYLLFDRQFLRPALSAPALVGPVGNRLQNFDDGSSLRLFSGGVGFSRVDLA